MVRHLLSHQNLADASPVFSYKCVPVFTEHRGPSCLVSRRRCVLHHGLQCVVWQAGCLNEERGAQWSERFARGVRWNHAVLPLQFYFCANRQLGMQNFFVGTCFLGVLCRSSS